MKRVHVGIIITALLLVLPAGAALADKNSTCSARNRSKALCLTSFSVNTGDVEVGTVKVGVFGDRNLSDNEIATLKDVVVQTAILSLACQNADNSSQRCANDIAVKVLAVVKTFANFDETKSCATVKKSKSCKYA